jgi:hypothetical protein
MKIYYLIFAVVSLLFIGCSSTYTIKSFSSKEKFYEDFNKSASGKTLTVVLTNDSTFVIGRGARVSNDSLFTNIDNPISTMPLKNIKRISYKNSALGGLYGFLYGIPAGWIAGGSLYAFFAPPTGRGGAGSQAGSNLFLTGLFSAPIISTIIGLIHGYIYTYQFSTESGSALPTPIGTSGQAGSGRNP